MNRGYSPLLPDDDVVCQQKQYLPDESTVGMSVCFEYYQFKFRDKNSEKDDVLIDTVAIRVQDKVHLLIMQRKIHKVPECVLGAG